MLSGGDAALLELEARDETRAQRGFFFRVKSEQRCARASLGEPPFPCVEKGFRGAIMLVSKHWVVSRRSARRAAAFRSTTPE